MIDHAYHAPLANIKMDRQQWPEEPLILGRSWTQYVATVLSLYCELHLVQSLQRIKHFWYKLTKISFFIIFDQDVVECVMSATGYTNFHILKTWISMGYSKTHISTYTDYFCVFWNGLDRKDAVFVIVPLYCWW